MVSGEEVKETKKWSYFELSDYHYMTYSELAALVKDAGSALVETGHSKDTIFNIYASTSVHWQVMANGMSPVLSCSSTRFGPSTPPSRSSPTLSWPHISLRFAGSYLCDRLRQSRI